MSSYDYPQQHTPEQIAAVVLSEVANHERRGITSGEVTSWARSLSALVTPDLAAEAVQKWYADPHPAYEKISAGWLNAYARRRTPQAEASSDMGVDPHTGVLWEYGPPPEIERDDTPERYLAWLRADKEAQALGLRGRERVSHARQGADLDPQPPRAGRRTSVRELTGAGPGVSIVDALRQLDAGGDW